MSVVFARTVVNGEDHGIKPFVLQLHDGQFMTPGVTIKYVSHTRQLLNNLCFIQSLAATRRVASSQPLAHLLQSCTTPGDSSSG
jgi:hypothetical protein